MAEKKREPTVTEAPQTERYQEPREAADPEHKDAGQQYAEEQARRNAEKQDG